MRSAAFITESLTASGGTAKEDAEEYRPVSRYQLTT